MFQFLPFFIKIMAHEDQVNMIGAVLGGVIGLVIGLLGLIAMWKIYTKAGKPGWAVLIPIYNLYILLEIVGRPWWWLLLFFVPLVNVVVAVLIPFDLAKSFGKGAGFGLGLIFLNMIFILILGFGSAEYVGPSAAA
jgi:hypothetical protein